MTDKKGTLIVADGSDGAGKTVQSKMLMDYLTLKGVNAIYVDFPNYESPSSTLVKKYLSGGFASSKNDVDNLTFVKQMSTFYAVDRVATLMTPNANYGGKTVIKLMQEGYHVICNRYTTSNMIHQVANLNNLDDIPEYLTWLENLEYGSLGIPRPDKVIYLDVPPSISIDNIKRRYHGSSLEDIHENIEHFKHVSKIKEYVIERNGWERINCTDGFKMLHPLDIFKTLCSLVEDILV